MIELHLPMPPSVNALYANRHGGGRQNSKKYLAWIDTAGKHLMAQTWQPLKGDIEVRYQLGPRCKKSDVMNREKAISDLLKAHGVIQDDRFIVKGTVGWADVDGCRVEIWPA